jgi:phenylpropionate dioxygenase-like ring-hydroxylating dioxygenase large terminal subunit
MQGRRIALIWHGIIHHVIHNQWYAILDSKEVKKHQLLATKRCGENLVVWRNADGSVTCLSDKCAHRGASLCHGKLAGKEVECPFHGLRYDASGKCTIIPSRGATVPVPENFKVRSFPARDEHGIIWIWWGEERDVYPEVKFFPNIDGTFSYETHACPWNVHYSRCIENQLDAPHVPFVHPDSIGKGHATIIDGPFVETGDGELKFYPVMRKEDGTASKLHNEMEKPAGEQGLHFIFPNVWQNDIIDKLKVVAMFAPVDEEHTVVYVRGYQKFATIPGFRWLFNKIGMVLNMKILHQDKAVVETQLPKKTSLAMNENLFPADSPIIAYRKMRHELQEQNPISVTE